MARSTGLRNCLVALALLAGCNHPNAVKPAAKRATDLTAGPPVRTVVVGRSLDGWPIRMHVFGDSGPVTFIFAGIHGDEPSSEFVALHLIEYLLAHRECYTAGTVAVLPSANPDGLLMGKRTNANGVDCNRNFPTGNWKPKAKSARYSPGKAPASEPETRAIVKAVETLKPAAIVSIHSTSTFKPCNNYDGPAAELAELMERHNGYPPKASVGYPTPGSFGTYAGIERKIPTITLELPHKQRPQKVWPPNRDALVALIRAVADR